MITYLSVHLFSSSAKVWWQFAGKCILNFIQERNKRQTWSYTITRAQTIVKYVRVYTKHLTEAIEDINTTVGLWKISMDIACRVANG